jgi:hypothetical protein
MRFRIDNRTSSSIHIREDLIALPFLTTRWYDGPPPDLNMAGVRVILEGEEETATVEDNVELGDVVEAAVPVAEPAAKRGKKKT